MGNKLEKQLFEQDINRVSPILNDVLSHCRKGNPKLNWLKVVHAISIRIIPLTAEAIGCVVSEKPPPGAPSATVKKWQKRLDGLQVTLHAAGAVLTNLGRLPPSVLQAPGFEAAVKTHLVPSLLRHALLHKGGFVTLELSSVLQQLPAAHQTLVAFLASWGAYLEDMTVTGTVAPEKGKPPMEGDLPDPTALCEAAINSFVSIAGDWAELDALCSVMLETERRLPCQLVMCRGLAHHLSSHASRLEAKALDALAAVVLAVVRHSLRVEGREDLCLAALACLRPLASAMADSTGLLMCASRAFASPDDCWPAKQAVMDCLACHLQAHPAAAAAHTLHPMLVKALEASEPGLGYVSVLEGGGRPPKPEAIATARSTLCCIAAVAGTPQCQDLFGYIARAALLYAEDCVPDALRCVGAVLEAGPAAVPERDVWAALRGVVADALRVPPAGGTAPAPLRAALQALEASLPPGPEPPSPAASPHPPLVGYTLEFYGWNGGQFHCAVPLSLRTACPTAVVAPLQELLAGVAVDQAIKQLCQRVASCLALRISAGHDTGAAEHTVRLFMEVLHSGDASRPWMTSTAPFLLHFGSQVCISLVLQLVTGQRDRYLSALKVEIQQLQAAAEQLTAEKAAAVAKLEALRRQADSALQLQQAMQCSVCLEALSENRPCALQCGHLFHLPCVEQVFQSGRPGQEKCPLCRTSISMPPLLLKGLEE